MSICFTWFPISGLGKPKLYQNLGDFTRIGDFTWKFWESVRSEGRRGFIWRSVHYFFPIDL